MTSLDERVYRKWLLRQRCLCGRRPSFLQETPHGPVPACSACYRRPNVNWAKEAAKWRNDYQGGVPLWGAKRRKPKPEAKLEPRRKRERKRKPGSVPQRYAPHVALALAVAHTIDPRPPYKWMSAEIWCHLLRVCARVAPPGRATPEEMVQKAPELVLRYKEVLDGTLRGLQGAKQAV